MNKKNITIVGGHGLMGQLFSQLFNQAGYTTHQIGKNDWASSTKIFAQTDWLIISAPINFTNEIISKAAKLICPTCILSDFTSIKTEPLMTMLSEHSGPVLGLHPMFGPTIHSTKNQVIVTCNGRGQDQYQWTINLLKDLGFTLKKMSSVEHDQSMSFIQGIEHFLTFGLGTFLHQKKQHPQQLMEMASPIYMAKLLLMGRIFDQDPKLYADIIMADANRITLIKEFSQWLNSWIKKIENQNKQDFIDEFKEASKWMGNFTSHSQQISDKFLNQQLVESISTSLIDNTLIEK